jgi:hypothetical protein
VDDEPTGVSCEFCGNALTRAPGYGHAPKCVYVVLAVAGGVTPLVVRTRQPPAATVYDLTRRLGDRHDGNRRDHRDHAAQGGDAVRLEILGMPDDPDRRWAAGDLFSLDLHKRNDGDDDNPCISITDDFSYFPAAKVVFGLRRVADLLEKKITAQREIRAECEAAQAEYVKLLGEGLGEAAAKRMALLKLLAAAKNYASAEIESLINDVYDRERRRWRSFSDFLNPSWFSSSHESSSG